MNFKKIIKISISVFIFNFLVLNGEIHANEKKMTSFITATGSTIGEARARAHNTAYMNGMKIIERKTYKNGDSWISIVKITPRH